MQLFQPFPRDRLPCLSHLRNLASGHGFTRNDLVFLFNVPWEPDHATLWRPAPSAFLSSAGEVRFLRVYYCFPFSAKRTSVLVLLHETLTKRRTAAHLAGFGVDCPLTPGGCSLGRTPKMTNRLYILCSNNLSPVPLQPDAFFSSAGSFRRGTCRVRRTGWQAVGRLGLSMR